MSNVQLVFDILANDKASKAVEGVGNTVETQAGKWDKWKVAGGVAAAAVGAAVVKFGIDSVQAYAESEQASTALDDAFARFPALADTNAEALRNLNSELARKTGFDDDSAAAAQASLAQYNLTGQQIAQLTPLLEDYAAKTGQDLPSAADALGKAMLGQGRALKSVGIDFVDAGSVGANFDQVVAGLTDKVGGYAEVAGGTAAGQTAILKDQFGELQESAGEKLLPALMGLVDIGLKVVDWVNNNQGAAVALVATFGVLTAAIALAANWESIYTTAKTIGTAAQWAWNAAMSANPIGLIIIAIAALIAIVVLVVTHFDQVKKVGSAAWDGIKAAWSGAGKFFSGIGDGISAGFKGAFNGVAKGWNNTVGKIGFTVPDWVPGLGGKRFDVPDIPLLAKGGDIVRAGLAVVGDAGPELLELPTGARVTPLNGRSDAGSNRPLGSGVSIGAITLPQGSTVEDLVDEIEWRARG